MAGRRGGAGRRGKQGAEPGSEPLAVSEGESSSMEREEAPGTGQQGQPPLTQKPQGRSS